jgi:uncharacterized protein
MMMQIHIDQLIDTERWLEFEEKAENFTVLADMIKNNEYDFLAPIKFRLRAYRVSDMVAVEGNLETVVRLSCSRCLSGFETQIASGFTLTYAQEKPDSLDALPNEEVELDPGDMGLIPFSGTEINLMEGIQEQVVMAFPLKPLCREKCKGLCPKCGANLNAGDCGCDTANFNNKFSVLKKLNLDKT